MPAIIIAIAQLSKRFRWLLIPQTETKPAPERLRDPLVLVALWLLVVDVIAFIERWLSAGF
jgi:L-arabinose isomerase